MREHILSITKKDFDIKFFSGTGAGGQHRNKHQNCVRMKHNESQISATGQSSKSRQANIREAFLGIVKSKEFDVWLQREISMRLHEGISVEEKVKQMMRPENLRIEYL